MEIYTNSNNRNVFLNVPVQPLGSGMSVKLYSGKDEVYEFNTVSVDENGRYVVTIPFRFVQSEQTLTVSWSFQYLEDGTTYDFKKEDIVEIVTPLLPLAEIENILNSTYEEAVRIERAVRNIIKAHTGQTFGKYVGKKSITGNGGRHLVMPVRLLRINSINQDTFITNYLSLLGDGWYLINNYFGIPSLKADYHGLHYLNDGVIEAPPVIPRYSWISNREYVIDGVWGWEYVPSEVEEAARILIKDYSCQDSEYRDKYIESVSAVDWRIQYNSGAFDKTGNVKADQLLSNYVLKRGWAVV